MKPGWYLFWDVDMFESDEWCKLTATTEEAAFLEAREMYEKLKEINRVWSHSNPRLKHIMPDRTITIPIR